MIKILLFLISFQIFANENCSHDKSNFRCVKFVKNYDADTITVNIPDVHPLIGDHISVRVKGVDTPEVRGKLPCEKDAARISRNLVENLLKNAKVINLINVEKDKYFRILADVEYDGLLLKDILLKNKLAYEYFGETKQKINWCDHLSRKISSGDK